VAIAVVAIAMGFASWPLLRLRKEDQVRRARRLLRHVDSLCRQYEAEHRKPPARLDVLPSVDPLMLVDPWHRPIKFAVDPDAKSWRIWSLGPLAEDPADDIYPSDR
jgi:type II secretory pathway pseudopilin PulG